MKIELQPSDGVYFREHYQVRRLCAIPAALNADLDSTCELNMLVEYSAGAHVGLAFFDLEATLSFLLKRSVRLYTSGFIRPETRARVIETSEVLYDAGQ